MAVLLSFSSVAQELKTGELKDRETLEPIPWAHIQNFTRDKYTVSNEKGTFELPMALGDSLWISCVGYQPLGIIIKDDWAEKKHLFFRMNKDTILLESFTVNILPNESIFKQRILASQSPEEISFYGIPKVKMGDPEILNESYINNLGFIIMHPVGFIYHKTSKKQKEKRKMHKMNKNDQRDWIVAQKYNREIVKKLTRLEGNELSNFMLFCDFDEEFLAPKSEYQIAELVVQKLDEFMREGKG